MCNLHGFVEAAGTANPSERVMTSVAFDQTKALCSHEENALIWA